MKGFLLAVLLAPWPAGLTSAQASPADAPKALAGKKAKAVAQDYTPRPAEYGKPARCPVTGEEFKVGPGTKAVRYRGKVYYFCCASCAPAFKKDPAKFLK